MKEDVVVGGGGGGFKLRLSSCPVATLDAVGFVSFALADVSLGSLGFEALVFDIIPAAAAPGNRLTTSRDDEFKRVSSFLQKEGAYAVSKEIEKYQR